VEWVVFMYSIVTKILEKLVYVPIVSTAKFSCTILLLIRNHG
jgi:hypothetical protein